MEFKDLTLSKNDFKHETSWIRLCETLDLPLTTQEIELKCLLRAAKIYTEAVAYEENNNTWPSIIKNKEE